MPALIYLICCRNLLIECFGSTRSQVRILSPRLGSHEIGNKTERALSEDLLYLAILCCLTSLNMNRNSSLRCFFIPSLKKQFLYSFLAYSYQNIYMLEKFQLRVLMAIFPQLETNFIHFLSQIRVMVQIPSITICTQIKSKSNLEKY